MLSGDGEVIGAPDKVRERAATDVSARVAARRLFVEVGVGVPAG